MNIKRDLVKIWLPLATFFALIIFGGICYAYNPIKPSFILIIGCIFLIWLLFSLAIFLFIKGEKLRELNFYLPKWLPLLINLICLGLSVLLWQKISYGSYYHGLDSSNIKFIGRYMDQAKTIINDSGDSFSECTNRLAYISSASIWDITLVDADDQKRYKIREISDKTEDYSSDVKYPSDRIPSETNTCFKSGERNFELNFKYFVTPKRKTGTLRALTCSLYDVFREKTNNFFQANNKWIGDANIDAFKETNNVSKANKTWQEKYFENRWRRSENIFFPLYFIILLAYLIMFLFNYIICESKEAEEYKIVHGKIFSNFKSEADDIKCDWDEYVNCATRMQKHNIDGIEGNILKAGLNTTLENITERIKKLPNIVVYGCQDTTIEDTLTAIIKKGDAIPLYFFEEDKEENDVNFYYDPDVTINSEKNEYCKVNSYRLSDIVWNILTNASEACSQKANVERENYKKYDPSIWLDIKRTKIFLHEYISVSINDNAGGFPKNILKKIYKESVNGRARKGKKRKGEGTILVKYFADYMKIKIRTENCIAKDNNKGAKVTLLIPIHKRKGV